MISMFRLAYCITHPLVLHRSVVILPLVCVCISFFSLRADAQIPSSPSVLSLDRIWQRTMQRNFATNDISSLPDERLRPFYHGVASGDPLSDRVIIWTRITPSDNNSITVRWRVATDTAFSSIVQSGEVQTNADRDFTVKVDVQGLQPNTTYYYGFSALGAHSLTGRTHTLPVGEYHHARFGVVSCSNYQGGYFNGYARIAEHNDLDAVLHLGDYIYEYASDTTKPDAFTVTSGRIERPNKEILTLSDYRTRYSTYRLDPDNRRSHQQHPFISVWDDHESANDSYKDGAQNHQPEEGDWQVRKAISKQAYYEWLPIRETTDTLIHRTFSFGDLIDLFMLDTRLEGREKQVLNTGSDAPQSSKDSLSNPNRTILGASQYAWLTDGIKNSTAQWKMLGNQVMFTPVSVSPIDTSQLSALSKTLLPIALPLLQNQFTSDIWTNYPAEQQRLISFLRSNNVRNVVIATGDFHCSLGYDVVESVSAYTGSNGAAVEFLTPSITAANFDENLLYPSLPPEYKWVEPILKQVGPELLAALYSTLNKNNPHLKYFDLVNHGYLIIDITKQRAQGDWFFIDTMLLRTKNQRFAQGYFTFSGESRLQQTLSPASLKAVQQIPAPELPPPFITSTEEEPSAQQADIVVLSLYPNPATSLSALSYSLRRTTDLHISIVTMEGREVLRISNKVQTPGIYSLLADCSSLPSGTYFYRFATDKGIITRKFMVEH